MRAAPGTPIACLDGSKPRQWHPGNHPDLGARHGRSHREFRQITADGANSIGWKEAPIRRRSPCSWWSGRFGADRRHHRPTDLRALPRSMSMAAERSRSVSGRKVVYSEFSDNDSISSARGRSHPRLLAGCPAVCRTGGPPRSGASSVSGRAMVDGEAVDEIVKIDPGTPGGQRPGPPVGISASPRPSSDGTRLFGWNRITRTCPATAPFSGTVRSPRTDSSISRRSPVGPDESIFQPKFGAGREHRLRHRRSRVVDLHRFDGGVTSPILCHGGRFGVPACHFRPHHLRLLSEEGSSRHFCEDGVNHLGVIEPMRRSSNDSPTSPEFPSRLPGDRR